MWYDLVVIGGGINGCGCAADAAMRGLSVLLCEQHDLASETSSKSSKLIHGGLRYLEHYQFHLVRHALNEQRILMQLAPYLIHPLKFVLPFCSGLRQYWLLRIGLWIYDFLARRTLPRSVSLKRDSATPYFTTLKNVINQGFLFYDAQTHDARLTVTVALQARAHGATVLTRTQFVAAQAEKGHWNITLKKQNGELCSIQTKALVNATGAWVHSVAQICNTPIRHTISFVKGSHIVTPSFYTGDHAYLLQTSDQRVVFVIPYFGQTLIGTTDILLAEPEHQPMISSEEIEYLKNIVAQYFNHAITQVSASWAGIRVLPTIPNQLPTQLSRDFSFELHTVPAPIVTILTGKITTYRLLARQVIDSLKDIFPNFPNSQTESTPLPGSTWQNQAFSVYLDYAYKKYSWLDSKILQHYLNHYGSRTELLLEGCTQPSDLGIAFGPILRQREVDFLCTTEWAQTAEDVLWRRTQLGLTITAQDQDALAQYLKTYSF